MISAFAFCGSSWLPTDLGSGLKLWLPPTAASITIATGVSQWNDVSGNGYHFVQATGGQQPAFNATGGPNSKPIVTFDGVDNVLSTPHSLSAVITQSAYTMVCVVRIDAQPDVGSDNADAAAYDNDGLITHGGGFWGTNLRRTGNRIQGSHFDAGQKTAGVDASLSTWYRVRVKYDGVNITTKVGALTVATTAASAMHASWSTSNVLYIGHNYAGSDFAAISLAEMFLFNFATSAGNDTNIDSYITSFYASGVAV